MSVTINAKGTSTTSFKVGKNKLVLDASALTTTRTWIFPDSNGTNNQVLVTDGSGTLSWASIAGSGTVTSVAISGANGIGISGSPITSTGTIALSLGAITPTSVAASGTVTGSNLSGSSSGTNTGDQTITLNGDVTGTGTGLFATTLATVNSNVGSFGGASSVPSFTVNAKGLITAASATAVIAPAGTLTGTTLASNVVSSSLTSVGTITSGVWNGTAIANANLANSSLTIGSTNIALGATSTTLAGLTSVTSTTFVGALTGNASTATALQTGRTFSATGDASGTSAAFDGTAAASIPLTLATVNASPQTDTFRKVTVNGKGLTTATSAVVSSDITTALGYTPVNKNGDTMTGLLVLSADPVAALGAVTKQYVDNVAAGLNAHASCITATTATLASSSGGTVTYSNGASGVGATLTTTGSFATIGGATTADTDRILVKNEATQANNGIYVRTSSTILTRASDFDNTPTGEISAGDFTYISGGTLIGTQWVQTTTGPVTVGTTAIVFSQLSGAGVVTAGTGINVTGNQVSNTGVLSLTTNTGLSTNVSATGNVTVTNTGVTSATGTANQIAVSAATGAVTFSLPTAVTISGTMTAGSFSGPLTGAVTGNVTGSVTGDASLNVLKAGDTMTGALAIQPASGNAQFFLNSTAGNFSLLNFGAGSSLRWIINKNNTAESGSNVGSNFSINRYDDAGTFLSVPFSIERSTGSVILSAPMSNTVNTAGNPAIISLTNVNAAGGAVVGYSADNNTQSGYFGLLTGGSMNMVTTSATQLVLGTSNSTRLLIAANGSIYFGGLPNPAPIIEANTPQTNIRYASNDSAPVYLVFLKSRGTSVAPTSTQAFDGLGDLQFYGFDAGTDRPAASISGLAAAAPANSTIPGAISFRTTPVGTSQFPIERMLISSDGRLSGTALHNNAGSVSGTTQQYIASGTYTPTGTTLTNVSTVSTVPCNWMRVGNVVQVSGYVFAQIGASAFTEFAMSYPIPSSASNTGAVGGTASSSTTDHAFAILVDGANGRVKFSGISTTGAAGANFYFTFMYLIT